MNYEKLKKKLYEDNKNDKDNFFIRINSKENIVKNIKKDSNLKSLIQNFSNKNKLNHKQQSELNQILNKYYN